MKKNNTPQSKGSTGNDSDNPFSPNPSRFTANGVRKAIKYITFLYEKKYNITTPNKIGSAYI